LFFFGENYVFRSMYDKILPLTDKQIDMLDEEKNDSEESDDCQTSDDDEENSKD